MGLKTFEVGDSKKIGVSYFGYDGRDHVNVIYNKTSYITDAEYTENCKIDQFTEDSVTFVGNGNYSSYGSGIAVALEESSDVVLILKSNNWNDIFSYEDFIRFYGIFI